MAGFSADVAAQLMEGKTIPEPNTGCLLWLGSLNVGTYGKQYIPRRLGGKSILAHRLSVIASGREIPPGMHVDHICRTPLCVNPDHLRVVTPRINAIENSVSLAAQRAQQVACSKCGQPFDSITKRGRRSCTSCVKAYRISDWQQKSQDANWRNAYNERQRRNHKLRRERGAA